MTARTGRPPGPPGRRWVGNLQDYEADRLGFLLGVADAYGDIATFDRTTTIVNSPELARALLSGMDGAVIVRNNVLQEPIPAHELDLWPEARRALNPVLRPRSVAVAMPRIRAVVEKQFSMAPNDTVDALSFWESVTSEVAADYFFGSDGHALPLLTRSMLDALPAVVGNVFALPSWVPTSGRKLIRSRFSSLREEIVPLLERRSRQPDLYDDGAAAILRLTRQGAPAAPLERVANVIIGSLLASHTVPAAAISWTLHLLTQHPRSADDIRGEARSLLDATHGTASAQVGVRTLAVFNEAVRLYPPTWLLSRTTARPVDVGGYKLPGRHTLLVSPYVLHRRASSYAEPHKFLPERWACQPTGHPEAPQV